MLKSQKLTRENLKNLPELNKGGEGEKDKFRKALWHSGEKKDAH